MRAATADGHFFVGFEEAADADYREELSERALLAVAANYILAARSRCHAELVNLAGGSS